MIDFESKASYDVYDLEKLVALLRSEGGCPWDAEQTHESIRRNFLEEAYEAVEAIDERDSAHLKEELGDVLLQVLFHARIEQEAGRFCLQDVADAICKKLIYRHPHVFAGAEVRDSQQVLQNWDELKKVEKHQNTTSDTLRAVAKSLPALWRAEKLQSKAEKAGLDQAGPDQIADKLSAAVQRVSASAAQGTDGTMALGDLLWFSVSAARLLHVDPEDALHAACERYIADIVQLEAGADGDRRKTGD